MDLIVRPDKPDPVSLEMFAENDRWSLVDSTAHSVRYMSGKTPFSRVQFWLLLKRDSTFYTFTYLVPIGLLSFLQSLTFLIPMHFSERISQATVVLLTLFFLEGTLASLLPKSPQQSLVQMYLNILIGLSVLTIGISIVSIEIILPDENLEAWGVGNCW